MSGAKSVRKGKVYERRTAVELRKVFSDAKRALQYQREHGAADVEAGPLAVEVKSYTVSTALVWRRAEAARVKSKSKRKVTAVVQPSGTQTGPVLITLPLRSFVKLLNDAKNQGWVLGANFAPEDE